LPQKVPPPPQALGFCALPISVIGPGSEASHVDLLDAAGIDALRRASV